ncbi:MAG: GNAT family N-acetyltransferase [Desulfobacterales bacterium]|jgi:predicted N-acyltransferase
MNPSGNSSYNVVWLKSLAEVDRAQWDALAGPLPTPFLEWAWLRQMEISESITDRTGWLPRHLTVWSHNQLIAAAPLYIKGHSAGEFVFDHAWAEVANRLKIPYYPKLVGMSPFTPMLGYRFLIASGHDGERLTGLMVNEIEQFCRRYRICSCNFLFVDPHWRHQLINYGFVGWLHQSFVWQNLGYQSFDDYLAAFNSNQRHNIKRERRSLAKQGVTMKIFQGDEIPPTFFSEIYPFYERTNDKFGPWGCKYLKDSFFGGLAESYRHRLVFVAAFEKGNSDSPQGLSLLVTKGDQLFGRYWGCSKEINNLHFNACYYSPIEWAIANGIKRFDPGAGGYHKIRRGFTAAGNYSLHRFFDQRLDQIMKAHIEEINRLEQEHIDELNLEVPFARKA